MEIPDDVFLQFTLKVGSVYYYENLEIKNSDEPHYHIVVLKNNQGRVILLSATTQLLKRIAFIEKKNLPRETFVKISPDSNNGFCQESGVDCNFYFEETEGSLSQIYNKKYIRLRGILDERDLARLVLGMQRSPLVPEEIKKLFL